MLLRPRCVLPRRTLRPTTLRRGHSQPAPSPPPHARALVTLAIESSCDDTAVAVLSHTRHRTELLFNERVSSDNRPFRGVNPLVALQGHHSSLAPLVQAALLALPPARSSADDDAASSQRRPPICVSSPICASSPRRDQPGGSLRRRPDFVSVTRGPGIGSNLSVGLTLAKGLALAWDVPLLGIHHMQAHALTPRLVTALQRRQTTSSGGSGSRDPQRDRSPSPSFPFLTLLVSGGHTQLLHSKGLTAHRILATTGDVALGNLLDQTARVLLPPETLAASPDVMYGRLLESFAFDDSAPSPARYASFFRPPRTRQDEMAPLADPSYPWTLPVPLRNTRRLAYSFSSIHTNVHAIAAHIPPEDIPQRRSLARHTLLAAFQHLASRLVIALQDVQGLLPPPPAPATLVVSGGVAANKFLMHVLRETLSARGFPHVRVLAPPVELCTDNAAMVAWAGIEMFESGWVSDLGIRPSGKWPLSGKGEDGEERDGILDMDGWLRRW